MVHIKKKNLKKKCVIFQRPEVQNQDVGWAGLLLKPLEEDVSCLF